MKKFNEGLQAEADSAYELMAVQKFLGARSMELRSFKRECLHGLLVQTLQQRWDRAVHIVYQIPHYRSQPYKEFIARPSGIISEMKLVINYNYNFPLRTEVPTVLSEIQLLDELIDRANILTQRADPVD